MSFIASDGQTEQIGCTALDEWFNYNPNFEIDEANRPRCYVHKDCGNLIESIINYNYTRDEIEELEDNVVMLHDNLVPLFPKEVA